MESGRLGGTSGGGVHAHTMLATVGTEFNHLQSSPQIDNLQFVW